jgi:hypothetical protein
VPRFILSKQGPKQEQCWGQIEGGEALEGFFIEPKYKKKIKI